MSDVNVPLLRKAVEWVETEATKPIATREWYQRSWRRSDGSMVLNEEDEYVSHCGTAYCVAGYVGQMLQPQFQHSQWAELDGKSVHVADFASEALGLTGDESERLFHYDNTAQDVRRIAEKIAGEPL